MQTNQPILLSLLVLLFGCNNEPTVDYLNSGKILGETLPFSEAVRVGNTLYLSGQLGTTPGTSELVDGGIKPETFRTMQNIEIVLDAHGYTLADLVKCTVMLADMAEWSEFNEVYRTFFTDHYPARSAFGTTGLAFNARVEVECLAVQQEAQPSHDSDH